MPESSLIPTPFAPSSAVSDFYTTVTTTSTGTESTETLTVTLTVSSQQAVCTAAPAESVTSEQSSFTSSASGFPVSSEESSSFTSSAAGFPVSSEESSSFPISTSGFTTESNDAMMGSTSTTAYPTETSVNATVTSFITTETSVTIVSSSDFTTESNEAVTGSIPGSSIIGTGGVGTGATWGATVTTSYYPSANGTWIHGTATTSKPLMAGAEPKKSGSRGAKVVYCIVMVMSSAILFIL